MRAMRLFTAWGLLIMACAIANQCTATQAFRASTAAATLVPSKNQSGTPSTQRTLDEWLAEPDKPAASGNKDWMDRKTRAHNVLDSIIFHHTKYRQSRHKFKHWRRIYKKLHPRLMEAQTDLAAKQKVHNSRRKEAEDALEHYKRRQQDLLKAKKDLTSAQEALTAARKHRDEMRILRANRTTTWQAADAAHKQAEASKAKASEGLNSANQRLSAANAALEKAQASHDAAVAQLKTAEQLLESQQRTVQSAHATVKKASDALQQAQQQHEGALTEYKQAKSALQDAADEHRRAREATASAQSAVVAAQKALEAAVAARREAMDSRQSTVRAREDADLALSAAAKRVTLARQAADVATRNQRVAEEHENKQRGAYTAAVEQERAKQSEYQAALAKYNQAVSDSSTASTQVASQRKEVEHLAQQVAKVSGSVKELETQHQALVNQVKTAQAALEAAQKAEQTAHQELADAKEKLSQAMSVVATKAAAVEAAKKLHEGKEAEASEAKSKFEAAEKKRSSAEAEANAASKEKDSMELSVKQAKSKMTEHARLRDHFNQMVVQAGGSTVPVAFAYKNWNFYRVRLDGSINSKTIRDRCRTMGMLTPCDHIAYADGYCTATVKRSLHLSHPSHSVVQLKMPKEKLVGAFFYAGGANGGRALQMWEGAHRWSTGQEKGGDIMCIKPKEREPSKVVASYEGLKFHRVMIQGRATPASMRRACASAGLVPACDHWAYMDGHCWFCSASFGSHMSRENDSKFPMTVKDRTMWYTGAANGGDKALQTWSGSHRWSSIGDMFEDAVCVEMPSKPDPRKTVFALNGYELRKVWVDGAVTSDSIAAACNEVGMKPACDHPSYADGKCIAVIKAGLHFSHPGSAARHRKGIPVDQLQRTYWYAGTANNKRSLFTLAGTHGWSTGHEMGGVSWCAKPEAINSEETVTWNNFKFHKTRVVGRVTPESILAACKKLNMLAPCGHPAYQDKKCVVVSSGHAHVHMSYPPHTSFPTAVGDRVAWYTGSANGGNSALQTWRGSHRWTGVGDIDEQTICIERPSAPDANKVQLTMNKYNLYRVRVDGPMTTSSIANKCSSLGMKPLCDHIAYGDGTCIAAVVHALHFSHPSHVSAQRDIARDKLQGAFFYAGGANGGKSLQMTGGTHRWSNGQEMFGDTFCAKRQPVNSGAVVAQWGAVKFHEVLVPGVATSANIKAACDRARLTTPCDHSSYNDGKCRVLPHMNGRHMSYNPHHKAFTPAVLDRTVWYTGNHKFGLMNWRGTHRWATLGDVDRTALCVE